MSLSDLAALGSFISGFAVLVSLVFLYFQLRQVSQQVRQSEKNQQAAIRQGRTNRLVDMSIAATEPLFAEAFTKGLAGDEDITNTQLSQFAYACTAMFRNAEDSFYQHEDGLLNESAFSGFLIEWEYNFVSPGIRLMWTRYRRTFGREFVEFMDKLISETPVRIIPDALARWQTEIVAQKTLVTH